MRLRIPRLKLAEASSLRLTHRSLDIEHYTGPKKINPPDLADVLPSQTDIRLLSASSVQAQNKDAAYYSQLRTDDAVEWSGFNSLKDRAQVFGPLIDSPPAQLSDDTDVFVLLVYWCKKADVLCALQMERWNGSVLDINTTVTALGDKCRGLLGRHALSGCDTVSYPNGRGKVSALRVLTQTDIDELDSVLGEESATQTDLQKAGTSFFLSLYCQKESTSLNAARHDIYRKRKNPPPLKSLPPTDANLALHVQRAHLQMLLWKAADNSDPPDIQLTDYGWEVKEHEHVMPAVSREPAAPSKLMDVISCSCKAEGKACSGRCSCGSSGLSCTSYCVCEGGNTCCNPHTQQEEDEDEPQQSDVDYDDLAGEESDWLSLWPSILVVLSDIQWLLFDVYLIVVILLC